MNNKDNPDEIDYNEWLKRQNYFLNENNKNLKKKLIEAEEYIDYLLNKLKLLDKKILHEKVICFINCIFIIIRYFNSSLLCRWL